MRTLAFEGRSDDALVIEGCRPGEPNQIDIYRDHAVLQLHVDGTNEGLHIFAEFGLTDWVIGVALLGFDKPLPDWEMSFNTASNGRSVRLSIEAPEDAVLRLIRPQQEDG